jgi:hypothetical protein
MTQRRGLKNKDGQKRRRRIPEEVAEEHKEKGNVEDFETEDENEKINKILFPPYFRLSETCCCLIYSSAFRFNWDKHIG